MPTFEIFNNPELFAKLFLLILLVVYTLFALVLTFQLFSFNRLMHQDGFAAFFKIIAILHTAISFILLLAVVFTL